MSVDFCAAVPAAKWPTAKLLNRSFLRADVPMLLEGNWPPENGEATLDYNGRRIDLDVGVSSLSDGDQNESARQLNEHLIALGADECSFAPGDYLVCIGFKGSRIMEQRLLVGLSAWILGTLVKFHDGHFFNDQEGWQGRGVDYGDWLLVQGNASADYGLVARLTPRSMVAHVRRRVLLAR